jgi:hypothetical protein
VEEEEEEEAGIKIKNKIQSPRGLTAASARTQPRLRGCWKRSLYSAHVGCSASPAAMLFRSCAMYASLSQSCTPTAQVVVGGAARAIERAGSAARRAEGAS